MSKTNEKHRDPLLFCCMLAHDRIDYEVEDNR